MPDASCPPSPPPNQRILVSFSASSVPSHFFFRRALPSTSMLSILPLELIDLILRFTFDHPKDKMIREGVSDPRSHGYMGTRAVGKYDAWSFEKNLEYMDDYHSQIILLLRVCKIFYKLLLPTLYAAPVLVTPGAIEIFTEAIASSSSRPTIAISTTKKSHSSFSSLVTELILYPLVSAPPPHLKEAWTSALPTLLPSLRSLQTLLLGDYISPLSPILLTLLPPSNLKHLDMIEIPPHLQTQRDTISLISLCPSLERMSLAGINLLEEGHSLRYSRTSMVQRNQDDEQDDDDYYFDEAESSWERFKGALSLRETCGVGKGLKSLFFCQHAVIGMGALIEMMMMLNNLKCLHLDAWTFLAPSSSSTPIYKNETLYLEHFIARCSALQLTELSFTPLFVDSIKISGNFDSLLPLCPSLRCLELRADHITRSFFEPLTKCSPSLPLSYLGVHVLPPHCPKYISPLTGKPGVAVQVFFHESSKSVKMLAQLVEKLPWPKGCMEEEGDESGWYEVLEKIGEMIGC